MLRERRAVRQTGQRVVPRHVHDLRFRMPAIGDVLQHAQHVARLAVLARDGEPFARDHARAVVRRGDRNILREQLLAGRQHLVVARGDEVGVLGMLLAEHVVGGLADHLVARKTEKFLAGAIDQLVALVAGVLDDQRRRHVLDDGVEERLGATKLAFGAQTLGDVLVGRDPAAAIDRCIPDRDGAPVGQHHGARFDLAALGELGGEFFGVAVEGAGRKPPPQQVAQAVAGVGRPVPEVSGDPVHFEVTAVVEEQPALRIEHQEAVSHVVERGVEARALPGEARSIDEEAGRKARRKAGDKTQRAEQDDQSPFRLGCQASKDTIHRYRAIGGASSRPPFPT